jgi:hypothetical protein
MWTFDWLWSCSAQSPTQQMRQKRVDFKQIRMLATASKAVRSLKKRYCREVSSISQSKRSNHGCRFDTHLP